MNRLPEKGKPAPMKALKVPVPVLVEVDGKGQPIAVTTSDRQPVARLQDRWRIAEGWWTPRPVYREYWSLVLENGACETVFRDELTGEWYEQRY